MMGYRLAVGISLALAGSAQAESKKIVAWGLGLQHQSTTLSAGTSKIEYSNDGFGGNAYAWFMKEGSRVGLYGNMSYGFWGLLGRHTKGKVTMADGTPGPDTNTGIVNYSDQLFFIVPQFELGAGFFQGSFHPTVGVFLGDDGVGLDSRLYYAIDAGASIGLAYTKIGKTNGFVAHLILRGHRSAYEQEPSFGAGHGSAVDLVLGARIHGFSLLGRLGTENHTLPRRSGGWLDAADGVPLENDTSYVHVVLGHGF